MVPVFSLVLLGYLAGPRLDLQVRTLSRFAYTVLTPAFTFNILSTATIEADIALRMIVYIVVVHLISAMVGFAVARFVLRRPPPMVAAYVMVAAFGNVGNFGLPIITFAFGEEALAVATVYFLAIMVIAFVIGVAAANWVRGSGIQAVLAVLKTPALLALPPAVLCNWLELDLPQFVARPVTLLAGALIPTMLVVLGLQLAQVDIPRFSLDMVVASGVRLLVAPALAFALAFPFGIGGLEHGVGVLQASMPAAVLTSIIASENDLLPGFVTATILFSTLVSVVTLTLVVHVVQLSM